MEKKYHYKNTKSCQTNKSGKRYVLGSLAIGTGILLILRNLGIIPSEVSHILFSWQMLLIAIGGLNLIFGGKRSSALILLSIGTFFMLPEIFDIPLETRKLFWPVILVIIGLILVGANNSKRFLKHNGLKKNAGSDVIDVVSIFGGSEQKITSKNFIGGSITSVFGGSEVDLSDAGMEHSEAVIEIFTAFGGTEIIIPPEWEVKINVTSILGGFSDERNKIVTDIPGVERKVLIIRGFTIFGGGTVSSY